MAEETSSKMLVAVEQHPEEPSRAIGASLVARAGAGLAQTEYLVKISFWGDDGMEGGVEVPVDGGEESDLIGVALVRGIGCIAVSHPKSSDDDVKMVRRSAFDSAGQILWSRSDLDKEWGADSDGIAPPLPPEYIIGNRAGEFIFGLGSKLVAVDASTGDQRWTAAGQYGKSVREVCSEVVVIEGFVAGAHGDPGWVVRSTVDGSRIRDYRIGEAVIDGLRSHLILSRLTDSPWVDDSPKSAEEPGLEVVDIRTGEEVYSLSQKEVQQLGGVGIVGAFDGRLVLKVADGIRVVSTDDGSPEAGYESVPKGAFRMTGVPKLTSPRWVLTVETNGNGDPLQYTSSITYTDEELSWSDLPTRLEASG